MYKSKNVLCLVMVLLLAMSVVLSGCGGQREEQAATLENTAVATTAEVTKEVLEPVELIYYFVAGLQQDLRAVNDEVDKILKEKINATVKLNLIDWGGYEQKMNVVINSGETYDLCFTASWFNNYFKNAANGAFLPLDELMDKYAPTTKAVIPVEVWPTVKVNGKIYGTINYQVMASGYGISVQKGFADKYGFDWKAIGKYEDLEPYLAAVKKGEPDKIPLEYSNTADMFVGFSPMYNMDVIGDQKSPGWVYLNDTETKVLNQYDTPEFKQLIKVTREWYKKGYFRKDASTTKDISADRKAAKYAALFPSNISIDTIDVPTGKGGLFGATGAEWYDKKIVKPLITNSLASATITAISKTSKNPERAMMFIELLNSDVKLFNTINWGIEGKHYDKIGDNKVKLIPNSGYNPGVPFEFGNNLNLYLMDSQPDNTITLWDGLNRSSVVSPLLGFSFDMEPVKAEIAQCQSVVDEYLSGLTTGTVDPDKYLPEFLDKLQKAGSDNIIAEKQKQIDAWKAANK